MAKQQTPYKMTKLSEIRPYERNPRIIPQAAVDAVSKSIAAFGFRQPIVVDGDGVILAGHTRYKAAQQLGLDVVPVVWQTDITEIQARGYRIADNKTAEIAAWDRDALDAEVRELAEMDDGAIASLGMSDWELDRILHECTADGPLEEIQANARQRIPVADIPAVAKVFDPFAAPAARDGAPRTYTGDTQRQSARYRVIVEFPDREAYLKVAEKIELAVDSVGGSFARSAFVSEDDQCED